MGKIIVIGGGGPAGLTAAYLFSKNKNYQVILFEKSNILGGIAKTYNYNGNRIDLGGHRFFSKSSWVMDFWTSIFPIQTERSKDQIILNQTIDLKKGEKVVDPEKEDNLFLVRNRLSRIFYGRKFYTYPVSLSFETLKNLGISKSFKIGLDYLKVKFKPIKEEKNLEDFFINRFGFELYDTFFKDYTEKVWGVSCKDIEASWGRQRVKGLDIGKAIVHAITKNFKSKNIDQKEVETSLIEKFLYPKYGPGQFWEELGNLVEKNGGRIEKNKKIVGVVLKDNRVTSIKIEDKNKKIEKIDCDYFISTLPIKDLFEGIEGDSIPDDVKNVALNLQYRDFFTVGVLLKKLLLENKTKIKTVNNIIPDNWIYIQEKDVKVGRAQIFNNWSPYLVKDLSSVWMGLEYFANTSDWIWNLDDDLLKNFSYEEMEKIGFFKKEDVLDSIILREEKAYPAYFGVYKNFDIVKNYSDKIENLFLIGRNGMHRYNNMDHSMLSAKECYEIITGNKKSKETIWNVNAEESYHETKS
ncbi:MAG: NAD(P)/FAD-dependent oxidoreductase [candidate division WOR-3 bacterium]